MYDLVRNFLLDCSKKSVKVYQVVLSSNVVVGSVDLWLHFDALIQRIKFERDCSFNWFAIETDEGNGTIHLLITDCGCYGSWFDKVWNSLHHSLVFMRVIDSRDDFDGLSVYLSTQCNVVFVDCSDGWRVYKDKVKRQYLGSLDGF